MKTARKLLLAILLMPLWISPAAAADQGTGAVMPGPVVIHMDKFPMAVAAGEYDLIMVIQDFPAGSGVPAHKHGGHVLVTVLGGELKLSEKGGERVVKAGESWTENPGDVHSVLNAGTAVARVAAGFLLPKGAEITTMVK